MKTVQNKYLVVLCVFALSCIVILGQVTKNAPRKPLADEFVYLSIAHDLNERGTFTDGRFASNQDQESAVPGRFFAPVYPYFLHAYSNVSSEFRTFIACNDIHGKKPNSPCGTIPKHFSITQGVISAIGITAIFVAIWSASQSIPVAALSLLVVLLSSKSAYYSGTTLTENAAFLGFYLTLAALVLAVKKSKPILFFVAGFALAFTTLARPSYLFLFYALIFVMIYLVWSKRWPINAKHFGMFVLGATVMFAPWVVRNIIQFGEPALTSGYSGFILVQRVAYNAMSGTEWIAFNIYGLPDFGDKLARYLFGEEALIRLNYSDPTSFYKVGNTTLKAETLVAAGGREYHLKYLLQEHILGNLFKHIAVSIPISLRGMWAGGYLGLIALVFLWPVVSALRQQEKLGLFLFVALPPLFMTGLHGFTSVNVVRYNMPMVVPFAYIVSFAVVEGLRRLRDRYDTQKNTGTVNTQ